MRKVLYCDLDRCVGCHACEVACMHGKGRSQIEVLEAKPRKMDHKMLCYFIPLLRAKCAFGKSDEEVLPVCVSVCPTKALGCSDTDALPTLLNTNKRICLLKIR